MALPANQWMFSSWVRIFDSGTEQNNTLRIAKDSGAGYVESTISIAAGLYYLGLAGKSNTSPFGLPPTRVADTTVFGAQSLLEAVTVALDVTYKFVLSLQTGAHPLVPDTSGKIYLEVFGGSADLKILWSHAETRMDPAWFGIAKNAGAYADTLAPAPTFALISQMSSSLCLVGQRVLGAEPQEESFKEVYAKSGDGRISGKTFGDGVDEISEFTVNVAGLPRDSVDSGFHSLRRWCRQLTFGRAKRRFLYIPDLANAGLLGDYPREWDSDDQAENRRWGWRDLCIDPLRSFAFTDVRRRPQSNREWQLRVPVTRFVG